MTTVSGEKTACVTGANGYVASLLVKQLLDKGYNVHATVRDPGNQAKVSHLLSLTGSERLKLFRADLTVEGSFDDPINGCHFVFHVASPVIFDSEDPENEIIKPAVQGTLNVLRTCAKTKTVKRVVLTSSTATVRGCREEESGRNLTEDNWSDVEFLLSEKPPFWAYSVSKTLAEKEAWKFAAENRIDLISVVSVLVSGPSLTPEVPQTVILALFLLMTDSEFRRKRQQQMTGSVSLVHVDDVCRAHIFLAEKDSASGRYICSAVDTNVPELAKFLSNRYPQHRVSTDFIDVSSEKVSGEKLIKEGFTFKFGIEEIYDESVEYLMTKGLLPK
ncbi:anthocyanidin reductase ((2S)-flavan-3-ol-forming)-like [Aristolochia californica]|uniref:anthocyanidin reductase ((2S)-flavan-3-ol-forming)-like n=1 Tax=Aristolochia californica TaxID=171875 RepID=UPI0035E2AC38